MDLITTLRTHGKTQAGQLAKMLGVSRPTLSRAVHRAGIAVVSRGHARRTHYAARRLLRGFAHRFPVYRIDAFGEMHEITEIEPIYPDGCVIGSIERIHWPLDEDMSDGWFEGLPYFIQDMRPQGFLGRHFVRSHQAALGANENPNYWTDDDVLLALSEYGVDVPGDLIVGEGAARKWLESASHKSPTDECLDDNNIHERYPRMADLALRHGSPGSSAGGEFPKFTALRRSGAGLQHVLVKFSGSDASPGSTRWADLLVCEHLAAAVLHEELGIDIAKSRIYQIGGRTFLEVDRFDRHGLYGRSGLVSLQSVKSAFLGSSGSAWHDTAQKLQSHGFIHESDAARITLIWIYGQLIGNTDMHECNLSFQLAIDGQLRAAPIYDMLPMLYAPAPGVELPPRELRVQRPLPGDAGAWHPAARAALVFWQRATEDGRISAGFRALCAANALKLHALLALA